MDHARVDSAKSLLILKARATSLAATEIFLRNRGWSLFTTTDVKEALLKLVEQKFSYVLISVDHGNKKTQLLPQLIRHKFGAVVLTFAESSSAISYHRLNISDSDLRVYAPVTGPAVERCITKYLRNLQTQNRLITQGPAAATEIMYRQPAYERRRQDSTGVIVRDEPAQGWGEVEATPLKERDVEYQQRHFQHKKKRSDALDTLIARGTQKSLLENVDFLDGRILQPLANTTHSGCIAVESERFSGYIVTALGHNEQIEETFLQNVKKMLFKYLKDNGEHVTESEAMNIRLKPVAFEPWALEYADFLRTSVHQNREVGVAFFPHRPVHPALENSARRDLAKIRLMDLKGDREVEFDLFLHLAANDKYILYTPRGGIFYQRQLDRLKGQGITHLHVLKTASSAVEKYHAQNYLNDLVEAFTAPSPERGPGTY